MGQFPGGREAPGGAGFPFPWPGGATRYSLREAVEEAWRKYPSVEAANAALRQAGSQIEAARDEYLPNAGIHLQLNHATRNNVLGATLPNQTLLPVSGFAATGPSARGVFGTAAGALLTWTAYDFGTRRAKVALAEAGRDESRARLDLVRYQLADEVADAWFRASAAAWAEEAAKASVARWKTAYDSTNVLVKTGLRPGADASRLRAELIRAETDALSAEERTQLALVEVARYLTTPEKRIELDADWVRKTAAALPEDGNAIPHPLLGLRRASIATLTADTVLTQREWLPKIALFSAISGRGSGARPNGEFRDGAAGLYPDTGNWAVGVGLTMDLFDLKRVRARKELREHRVEEARARETETSVALRTLIERARLSLATARAIQAKMPETLSAAQELLSRSEVRYRTGLGTITELAEAQRLLEQAEVDDALAKVGVWRAAYGLAAARGDLAAFLEKTP
ncbi:MAG: TolC family protein [Bryobacterales bacterium]|nr:TolC family protein [Bryobacterales bacterium]